MTSMVLRKLAEAVIAYDPAGAEKWARKAVEEGIDPVEALNALTDTIREVGDGFEQGELFLPDLVGAASAMQAALPVLQKQMEKLGTTRESMGVIVIGTVFGDIHTIGKTMVSTLCAAEGFEVHDIGVNVTAEGFIDSVKRTNADIVAISALMTITAPEIRQVIQALKREGLRDRVKVMVGGGGVTESFAEQIGADGYDPTAPGAAKLARKLVGK
jgi:corrinoid protein of di/trimethylamine methyltransferase